MLGHLSQAQEVESWTLDEMIRYATEHNIQVKQTQLNAQANEADYRQAKANRLPSLSASGRQTFTAGNNIDPVTSDFVARNTNATSMSVSSDITLFNGNRISNNIKENALWVESGKLSVVEAENDITIALTQAYLQALYYKEEIGVTEENAEASAKQLERTQALFDAGSASAQELAQLKSEYANDQSALVSAKNQHDQQILILKQLLELGISDTFEIVVPAIPEDLNFAITPKSEAYQMASKNLPQVKNSKLGIDISTLQYKQAQSGYFPVISLYGSIGTGYTDNQNFSYSNQLNNNLYQQVGISLSIPIFDNLSTSTSVQKAQINREIASLDMVSTQKEVLQTIENTYQDLTASLSQLEVAEVQLDAANESYRLSDQQFQLGMLNLADFILQRANYQTAQQAYLQAKYNAILNYQLYEFYQGNPIKI